MIRRSLLVLLLCWPGLALAADEPWQLLKEPGTIILFRHANAPGTGDPPGFTLGDCATQRNLDGWGRAEARAIGEAFRARGVPVGMVLASQWCRSRDTAELAFPGQVAEEPAFNSFFGNRAAEPAQTEAAQAILRQWQGPGVLVVVTHQVNISALTDIAPRPGEGIVVRSENGALRVVGRLPPPSVAP
jgi:phosphohistidine phosphatase SixA